MMTVLKSDLHWAGKREYFFIQCPRTSKPLEGYKVDFVIKNDNDKKYHRKITELLTNREKLQKNYWIFISHKIMYTVLKSDLPLSGKHFLSYIVQENYHEKSLTYHRKITETLANHENHREIMCFQTKSNKS